MTALFTALAALAALWTAFTPRASQAVAPAQPALVFALMTAMT